MQDRAMIAIARLSATVARVPLEVPVRTAFGAMRDRAAVFVRVEDRDGAHGWGEIWCNFPAPGAEHRARLAVDELAPQLLGESFAGPEDAYGHLVRASRLMVLQSGEAGPFAQTIAGIDTALWDLAGRRAGVPLRRLLNPAAGDDVRAYASGIDLGVAPELVARAAEAGFRDFKVKVGVRPEGEADLLRAAAAALPQDGTLMADANQAWDLEAACGFASGANLPAFGWLEEPLAADASIEDWRALGEVSPWPLAAGENLRGETVFRQHIDAGALGVLQPDVGKWGGVSGCFNVARAARDAGLTYCPHFLGSAVGLRASAELLAAAGGEGLLEVDVNPNPLRTDLTDAVFVPRDGRVRLGDAPGLGITPDRSVLDRWRVAHFEARA